jgi:membrane protein
MNRRLANNGWRFAGYAALALIMVARATPRPSRFDHLRGVTPGVASAGRSFIASLDRGEPPKALSEPSTWWRILREAALAWVAHKASRLGAALAYYSIFSLGPLMLITVAFAGLIFGDQAVRGELTGRLASLLGEQGGRAVEFMLASAGRSPSGGILASIFGLATLLLAAVGIVVQLKDALNTIWVIDAPKRGVWGLLRTYAMAVAGVLVLGLLLLGTLMVTAALSAMRDVLAPYLPMVVFHVLSFIVSLGVIALTFAIAFKMLPDVQITWRDVLPGAVFTAVLFAIGSLLTGLYIGYQGLASAYGAAASLVVLLVWVYYSAQIILFGAEFTRVYTQTRQQAN